jgi:hypothetical protein
VVRRRYAYLVRCLGKATKRGSLHSPLASGHSEVFTYDGLDRTQTFKRGSIAFTGGGIVGHRGHAVAQPASRTGDAGDYPRATKLRPALLRPSANRNMSPRHRSWNKRLSGQFRDASNQDHVVFVPHSEGRNRAAAFPVLPPQRR